MLMKSSVLPILECLRIEKSSIGSKVYRRQVCMGPPHCEVSKTNGHPVSLAPSFTPELHPMLRLGRPFHLRLHTTQRYVFCLFVLFCFVLAITSYHFVIHVIVPCKSINISAFLVGAYQTVPAPACTRRHFLSKWCRAQHTAPHLAAYAQAGTTALRRRSDIRTKEKFLYSISCSFCWLLLPLLCLCSLFVRRRKRSTGSSWLWSLVASHLSFATATLTPPWGHTEICTYLNEVMS